VLLALDVGNTNITPAFSPAASRRQWRVATDPASSSRALGRELKRGLSRIKGVVTEAVYGSVVPALDRKIEKAVMTALHCRAVAVTPRSPLGMRLKVKRPAEVGADRILNALAAHSIARGACVVIDFGTATTFDCVSKRGDYLGGAILRPELGRARAS